MKTIYTVQEAFERLKELKITSNIESVRRWLRQGTIVGISPSSKKEGWRIEKDELDSFIQNRIPSNTTNISLKAEQSIDVEKIRNDAREAMWFEITRMHMWQGFIEIKKGQIKDCLEHRRYSQHLAPIIWERCIQNSIAYKKPRIFYLLDAFKFEGKRLMLDENFGLLEEKILFPMIEYVRKNQ